MWCVCSGHIFCVSFQENTTVGAGTQQTVCILSLLPKVKWYYSNTFLMVDLVTCYDSATDQICRIILLVSTVLLLNVNKFSTSVTFTV